MKNIKKAHETAEARMAIIAPLLAPGLDKDTVRKLRETIAETNQVSQRSLDRYLRAYHNEGFNGLLPEGKNPEVKYKIPPDIVAAAIQLRRELPSRSIPTIIEILEMEGKVEKGFLKRTTLQDALQREGYSASMMKIYRDPTYGSQRFQRLHRNDLWQGDIKYGPTLKINGLTTPTYLSCLIDDATRMILHGEFYSNMTEAIVEGIDLFDESDTRNRQTAMLHERISKLQPFDRAIVLLWLENMSYDEIGAIVGISPKNVSVRLVRIKEQLKKSLTPDPSPKGEGSR